jgi:carboxypeptidase family protein/TonB-dependent receptor-like protein
MRLTRLGLLLAAAFFVAHTANAQSTGGTIRGRLTDTSGMATPGATVSVTSANLQGARVTTTSQNGDYLLSLLPPGAYHVTFELAGFQSVQRDVYLAPTEVLPMDVSFNLAAIEETIQVVGTSASILSRTAQVTTSFPQPLIATLPTNRDLSSSLLLAPSVHQTGAGGGYSIAGSVSFENLFMINGVSVVDNLRGQPYDLYVEDAIQETSVATSGVSAEYGRFTGGVVNVVTKSGGNLFSGSLRDTLQNDKWRAYTPFETRSIALDPAHKETRVDHTVPTYEYTLGGPALRDRLWFFTSARMQTQETARTLVGTGIPYVFSENAKRYELNGTYSLKSNHRIQAVLIENNATQVNQTQGPTTSMDRNSLYDARRLMNLFTVNYSGVLSSRWFVEGRYSLRNETLKGVGGKTKDRIGGTLLIDRSGRRYWAATFCGVCGPEERDGEDIFAKASYFLSTKRFGSHQMVAGYDGYNDKRLANNHQSASDYRVLGTNAIISGTGETAVIYPQFLSDGNTLIAWQPILTESEGSNFRTHALFYNDNWRMSNRVTANLGLRYDRNQGANSVGALVANRGAFSPRLGVVLDPIGDHKWSVTGSVARYVAGIANTIADFSSPGGNFDSYAFAYTGPAINADPNGKLLTAPEALAQLFNWYDVSGGPGLPMAGPATVRGVTPQIRGSLKSPHAWEYSTGVSREITSRGSVRADVTYRNYHDFYAQRTDLTTGRVTDTRVLATIPPAVRGRVYDLSLIENTDLLKRRYAGLTTQGQYTVSKGITAGANYTLSRLWGNADGENANSGPTASDVLQYPEYKAESWNYPEGDLSADQRHRARAWLTYVIPRVPALSIGLLQIVESGVPYGAVGTINSASYKPNPGYLAAPTASSISYFYTARDAFRTEGQRRTDLAINYTHRLRGRMEIFGQIQTLNIFNHYQLCGCGASTVFQSGGSVTAARLDQAVRTPVTSAAVQAFNPFTTTPQRGVNWDYGPAFGTATSRFAYTTPRTMRFSFGVRF